MEDKDRDGAGAAGVEHGLDAGGQANDAGTVYWLVATWSNGDRTLLLDALARGRIRELIRAFNSRLAKERKAGLPSPTVNRVTDLVAADGVVDPCRRTAASSGDARESSSMAADAPRT